MSSLLPAPLLAVTLVSWLVMGATAHAQPDANTPATFEIKRDLRYGQREGRAGSCDVYLPELGEDQSPRPVVVVVHGGAWISGDKWTMWQYCRTLAESGIVAISINYRLAPTHQFPKQADDLRQALIWTVDQADKFQIDIKRLGLYGYSAGAHLSALVGVLADEPMRTRVLASEWKPDDPRWERLPTIRSLCLGGPPCDFRDLPANSRSLAYFLGGSRDELPDVYRVASPTAHVSASDPPCQIIHGEADMMVPIDNSRKFCRALNRHGVSCQLSALPDQGHIVTFLHDTTRKTVLAWFSETL